ncbi:MAG: hypothetical protein C9356_16350 [Oleiphilus sp.]|nr:MAG: hypothetical protein C9356_16350 [Oleiphilus sp.]
MTLDQLLNKTCLIGLTYMSSQGEVLKQAQHAGTVIKVDAEEGITVRLMPIPGAEIGPEGLPEFHLPPGLEAWFVAPKGHYRQPDFGIDIQDPDFFVTWDIVRKKDDTQEGKQQWWEWHPRTSPPSVN